MKELLNDVDINATEARFIAAGLRALARCDGLAAAELGLIEQFEREIGIGSTAHDTFDAASNPLRGPEQVGVLLRTLVMISYVDGRVSAREETFIAELCVALGIDAATRVTQEVEAKKFLLASLRGVEHFRDQAVAVGRRLGLNDAQIAEAIG